ncbi:hypothetical protein Tco_0647881 [Tanacetum coccineum]
MLAIWSTNCGNQSVFQSVAEETIALPAMLQYAKIRKLFADRDLTLDCIAFIFLLDVFLDFSTLYEKLYTICSTAPVVVPLLPTLVHDLAEHNSSKFVVLACIIGLYSSVMIVQKFFSSLIGGVMLVLLIQSTNVLVGYVSISWHTISFSIDAVTLLKLFGEGLRFVGQGILTIANVALVEETLFRSWLPEEIDVDLGFNQGIILSGLACSLCHWYSF